MSVINDLSSDRRVDNSCRTMVIAGYSVLLIGRKKRSSFTLQPRTYKTFRFCMLFEKGFLFYAFFNIRLFFRLLFLKADLLYANDLDTLLPNYLVSKIKGIRLIYDSHEYFTEVPELVNRPSVQRVWEKIEKKIFPHLKDVITVNDSIADLYSKKYDKKIHVVRNLPPLTEIPEQNRLEIGLPPDQHIIIMQGAGINIQRGAEEAVEAMQFVNNAVLLIVGDGDVLPILRQNAEKPALKNKIIFVGRQPMEKLKQYTAHADIGLSLDKDTNINYRYSLPNKLFDYIHAAVPVLASPLTEVKKIIDTYQVGLCIEHHTPEHIAGKINEMLSHPEWMTEWKKNCIIASQTLNWEKERLKLLDLLNNE